MATTKLKLHRETPAAYEPTAEDIPATFRFPAIPRGVGGRAQSQRLSLVAGRVEVANTRAEAARDLRPPLLRFTGEDGTVRTPELIRNIERTLEAMQSRVERLRRHADEPYKFPAVDDDNDRPTAA